MTPKIVLLNGPPHSGKDTIASGLAELYNFARVVKFAAPLKTVARELYCNGDQKKFDFYDSPKQKGIPNETFFGKSCRQVQIDISETYGKPMHGERFFGKVLASTINYDKETEIFLVSDSGFRPEAEELIERFGADNVILVRLKREGTSYDGDSRSYIHLDDYGVVTLDVTNEGSIKDIVNNVYNILRPFLRIK